jgi:hypothetical protein
VSASLNRLSKTFVRCSAADWAYFLKLVANAQAKAELFVGSQKG